MATVFENQTHPAIDRTLGRLRSKIRSYVLSKGMATLIITAVALFWISLIVEEVYFFATKLELSVAVRTAIVVVSLLVLIATFVWTVTLRMSRRLRPKALALVLERRFPVLQDRLITAVEGAESTSAANNPLTHSMLDRTIQDVTRLTDDLDLSLVFDHFPLRRRIVVALLGVLSIFGLQFVSGETLQNWQRAFVSMEPTYRNRDTDLKLFVITQPGDQIKTFQTDYGNPTVPSLGVYKHPRGADFEILIKSSTLQPVSKAISARTDFDTLEHNTNAQGESQAKDIELSSVELTYELVGTDGETGHVYLAPYETNEFRHSISSLMNDVTLWVTGGDYATPRPYYIQMVEPPTVENVSLDCLYPEYTRWNLSDDDGQLLRDQVEVQGSLASLPMETEFDLSLKSNKPLVAARILTDVFEISIDKDSARVRLFSAQGDQATDIPLPIEWAAAFQEGNPQQFSVPFILKNDAQQLLADLADPKAIPLPPNLELRIELDDVDGVTSQQPVSLTIEGKPDLPPVIDTKLVGVGRSVTRKAILPVAGTIEDDYGLTTAHFEYRIGDATDTRRSMFRRQPEDYPRSFELQRSDDEPFEHLDILNLDLKAGQKMTLTVFAVDGDNRNGPHEARGNEFVFEIVTDEELLSLLYGRELNQRRRLEQIISEVEKTREELKSRQTEIEQRSNKSDSNANKDNGEEVTDSIFRRTILASADRLLLQTRKNGADIADMEGEFIEILLQLKNNRVATKTTIQRLQDRIVSPLHQISNTDFSNVDEILSQFKNSFLNNKNAANHLQDAILATDKTLRNLQNVLKEMQELVKLHAFIGKLKAMIEDQTKLKKSVEQKNKSDLFDALKDLE